MKKKLVALLLVALMLCLALVGCGDKKADEILANAKEYLEGLQQESITTTNTPGDYEVPGKLQIDGVNLTVEWSVNVENGVKIVVAEDGTVTVDVDEMAEEDIAYTLTAKIVYEEGKTIETSFEYVVPKFKELTWSEFQATEDDEPVVIKGVITGIVETSKENDLYLQDENGGYFAYALEKKPSELGLKIGMTVRVRGIKDTYYGVHQVAKPTVEILDSTIKTVKALDITKTFTDAKDLKADELIKVQSMLVTIKGATVLGQNASNDSYYDFTLGGKTAYVRISSTTSMLSSEDEKSFKAAVADNVGYSADITGLVSIYSGNIYIIPVTKDAFSNFKVINRTPAEQVEFVGGLLSVTEKITENATIELTTTNSLYKDVEITWALTENACATLNGNVLKVVLPDEACELTLTATIKSGEATATKTFKIKVNAMSPYVAMPIGKAPVVGEKYKFALKQKALGSTLYFTAGEIVNKVFLPTTTDATKASDVFLEAVEGEEGKYYLAYMDGAAKYYIDTLYVADSGKVGNALTIRPNAKYEYDEKIGTLTTTVKYTNKDNVEKTETYYIGTYGTYDTFSSSLTSYATNATSYVAKFCTVLDVTKTSDEDKIKTEKAELTLPETVKVDGTEITLPEYGEYFIKVGITWALGEGVTGATIEDGVLTVNLEKDARNIKVIATIKHGTKTDTKEFTIAVDKLPTTVPQVAETVVAGTAYKLVYFQTKQGKYYYFDGTAGDYYGNMTAAVTDAVDVYKEEATGGYYIYFLDKANENAKTYVEAYMSGTFCNLKLTTEKPASVWFDHETLKVPMVTLGEKTYFLGTYGDKTDLRPSHEDYLDDGNYITDFYTLVDVATIPAADKLNKEKDALDIETEFKVEGEVTLPVAGTTFTEVAITWEVAANDGAVKIEGGKLIATPQAAAATVKVTATLAIDADNKVTKEFTVTVAKKVVLAPVLVTNPVAGKDYYIGLVFEDKYNFLNGATQNNYNFRLLFTQVFDEMIVFQLEETTGGFYLKTKIGEADKYLNIVKVESNGNSYVNTLYQDTAASVWTWSETYKTLTVTVEGMGEYAITQTGTYENVEAKTVSTTGVKAQLFTLVDMDSVSDADKVAQEKENLTFVNKVEEATSIDLPAVGKTFDDVVIEWAVSTNACATITDGKLVVTLPAVDGDDVIVTLTATIKVGTEVSDTKEFSVTVVAPTSQPTPIADVVAATEAGTYKVAGLVVVVDGKSFLLKDSTGYILVYTGDAPTVAAGDLATVEGTTTKYNSRWQLKDNLTVTKTGTDTLAHPTATVLDATALGAFANPVTPSYVQLTGVLSASGNFFNVIVDGASKQGSLSNVSGDLKTTATALNGKLITVTGYTIGVSSGKFVNIMVTSVEETTTTDAEKAEITKNTLSITTNFTEDGTLTLPATGVGYTNAAITWTVNGSAATGSYTITRTAAAQTLTVVATITCGTATPVTKEFTVTVDALPAEGTVNVTYNASDIGATVIAEGGYVSENGEVKIAATTGTNTSNSPVFDTQIRIYSSNSGHNILTIEVATGYRIKEIVFTSSAKDKVGGTFTFNNGDADWSNVTAEKVITITQAATGNDNKLELYGTAQLRILTIEITYEPVPAAE